MCSLKSTGFFEFSKVKLDCLFQVRITLCTYNFIVQCAHNAVKMSTK